MTRNVRRRLVFAMGLPVLLGLVSGCRTRLGDLTLLSTKNVTLTSSVVERSVEGKDCVQMLLFIPISGRLNPTLDEAMADAMSNVPDGNIMTDVALYNDVIFTLLYNQLCYRVKGDVGVQK